MSFERLYMWLNVCSRSMFAHRLDIEMPTSTGKNVKPSPANVAAKASTVLDATETESVANSIAEPVVEEVEEVEEVKPLGFYDGPDEIAGLMFAKLVSNINTFKTLQSRLAMAEGNTEKAIADFISSSQDDTAIQIRNQIMTLQKQLRAYAEKSIKTESLSDDDRAKLKEELESVKVKVQKGFEAIPNMAESSDQDVEGVMAVLKTIPNPTKSNRGRKPGTPGTTGPHASAIFYISGGGLDSVLQKDTFSAAALWLKCEVSDLQKAFAEAADKDLAKISEVNSPTEFEFTSHDKGKTFMIRTTPKVKAKPGRKPANAKAESAVATPAA